MSLPTISTTTDIANLALSEIGARQLTDIETDTTEEGKACRQFYTITRDSLLRSYQWNFATKRAELTSTTAPTTEWTSAWTLPSDHVRLIRIVGEDPSNPVRKFALEGRKLLVTGVDAATEHINIVYVCNSAAITDYDSLFIEALVFKLASKIARRITEDMSMENDVLTKFNNLALVAATNADAREVASGENFGPQSLISQSNLVRSRFGSRSGVSYSPQPPV